MATTYSFTGTKQTVAIPAGTYKLECWGAEGGSANGNAGTSGSGAGGKGAYATVTVNLPSCTLVYAVGGMPAALSAHTGDGTCASGGGMTAIAIQGANTPTDDIPLLVAGGGGGGTEVVRGGNVGGNGQGFGGAQGNSGGGWNSVGTTSPGKSWVQGLAAVNGATYGGMTAVGAFGGGGGGQDDSGGGGGAGYYGGGYGKPATGGYSYATSLYAAKDAAVNPGTQYGNGQITITGSNFSPSGDYTTLPIDLSTKPNNLRIRWSEAKPTGTTVTVQTGVTTDSGVAPTDWADQLNGELISNIPPGDLSGHYLWIKARLATTDPASTPQFSNLVLEEESPKTTRVMINLANGQRMDYPQGQVSVAYNPGYGNLTGVQGSSILAFTQTFTPTNIVPLFNPNDVEKVQVSSVTPTAILMTVNYSERYTGNEQVQVASMNITATLTNVADLP